MKFFTKRSRVDKEEPMIDKKHSTFFSFLFDLYPLYFGQCASAEGDACSNASLMRDLSIPQGSPMALHFITRLNKKSPPRFQVIRYVAEKEREALGHLSSELDDAAIEKFSAKLPPEEQLELNNFVSNMRFNQQHFKVVTTGALLDREILHIPPEFHQAIFKTWQFAKEQGIDFNPHEIMLNALLEKIQALQEEKRRHQDTLNERLHTGGQALFQAMVNLGVPLQEVADHFRLIAQQRYGKKNVRIKKYLIEEYAKKPARYSYWYNGVAVDVLLEYGKNPLAILPLHTVLKHWMRLRIDKLSQKELKREFIKQLKISTDAGSEFDGLFDEIYSDLKNSKKDTE